MAPSPRRTHEVTALETVIATLSRMRLLNVSTRCMGSVSIVWGHSAAAVTQDGAACNAVSVFPPPSSLSTPRFSAALSTHGIPWLLPWRPAAYGALQVRLEALRQQGGDRRGRRKPGVRLLPQLINCAATVAPRFQHASSSTLLGLPDTTTVSAACSQPSPPVMASTARWAPSVPSLPCR